MADNKSLSQFTLLDVIERKIQFIKSKPIFDIDYDEGQLLIYYLMLADVKEMNEDDFMNSYLEYLTNYQQDFECNEYQDKEKLTNYFNGCRNAILSILKCINPIYEFQV